VPKARILFVIDSLGRGGAEKQLHLLLKYLDRDRFAPTVACLSVGGPWAQRIRDLDVPVIEIPRRRSYEPARLRAVFRVVRSVAPHILQTFSAYDTPYGFLAGRASRVPALVASQRTEASRYARLGWTGRLGRFLWRWADAIICNSEPDRRRSSWSFRRHVVIYNGVEPMRPARSREQVRRALGVHDGDLVVGSVGRLEEPKNYPLALEVARQVLATHPRARFLLVGGGSLEADLRARIRHLGLEERVQVTGERSDVADLMNALDVFLMTSDSEGMPNAAMEAGTLGLPCVVTDAGASAEVVAHGRSGFVCPVGDREGLVAQLRHLLDDAPVRRRFGEAARARMAREFSPERMAGATEALYERLLATKAPPGLSPAGHWAGERIRGVLA
jgi:glycosyltransferase involved in cell wall biosynthesis